jgi:hypothetical protein
MIPHKYRRIENNSCIFKDAPFSPNRDMCGVLSYNIELYRQTVSAVGGEALASMTPAARERALQREMRACGHLHVALKSPEGHYKVWIDCNYTLRSYNM